MADAMADTIDTMIAGLRSLPSALDAAAQAAAPGIEAAIKADVAAGRTPGGAAWKPTKTGKPALVHAADHIKSRAIGRVVQTELQADYYYGFHQRGDGSMPARPMLPEAGIPPKVAEAMRAALDKTVGAALKGAK